VVIVTGYGEVRRTIRSPTPEQTVSAAAVGGFDQKTAGPNKPSTPFGADRLPNSFLHAAEEMPA
jgi:hypothetical protein